MAGESRMTPVGARRESGARRTAVPCDLSAIALAAAEALAKQGGRRTGKIRAVSGAATRAGTRKVEAASRRWSGANSGRKPLPDCGPAPGAPASSRRLLRRIASSNPRDQRKNHFLGSLRYLL
jgi:hypothetical protein